MKTTTTNSTEPEEETEIIPLETFILEKKVLKSAGIKRGIYVLWLFVIAFFMMALAAFFLQLETYEDKKYKRMKLNSIHSGE